jgi:hypothetical protein
MKTTRPAARFLLPRLLACAPLALPAASLVMSARPAQAQPLPEKRVISGRITGADGKGVAKATVTIQRENDIGSFAFWGAQTATDANGNFSFPEAEDGSYFISVEAESYAPSQNRPLRVDDNSSVYNARIERLANLNMRLLKADGTPLSKARVTLRLGRADAPGGVNLLRRQTDAQGTLQIPNQVPGAYSLDVVAAGEGYATLRDLTVRAEATQPTEIKLQRGGSLKVTARDANEATKYLGGATLSLSAALDSSPDERRTGRLSGRIVPNLQSLYTYSADGSSAVTRDGDGVLELGDLPPGRYRAKLVLPSYAPSETREVEITTGQSSAAEFALVPQSRASSLKVKMLDKDGKPLPNRDWTLQLRSLGNAPGAIGEVPGGPGGEIGIEAGAFGVLPRRARTDDKGEITLFPLRAGRWRVAAFSTREDDRRSAVTQGVATVDEDGSELVLTFRAPLD